MLLRDILQEIEMRVGSGHYVSRHPHDPSTFTVTTKKGKLVPTVNAKTFQDVVRKSEKAQKRKRRKP